MPLNRKVQVILYRNEPAFEVLLLKRTKTDKGEWHPVTGNVERHEEVIAAARREVEEETGWTVTPQPLGQTFTYNVESGARKGRYHETVFIAKAPADEDIELSEEHSDHAWLTPADAAERVNFPEQRKALEALAARQG